MGQIKVFGLSVFLLHLAACTHVESSKSQNSTRCVASSESLCQAVFNTSDLNSAQITITQKLLQLTQSKSTQADIIKTLDSLIPTIAKLSGEDKLRPVLLMTAQKLFEMGKLPPRITKENLAETVNLLAVMIENQFLAKSLSEKSKHKYVSWLEACRKIENTAQSKKIAPRGPDYPSAFENADFIHELENITGSNFKESFGLKLLVNGPQSFPLREKLIRNAKKTIYVMSWAFEEDVTGWKFAKLLLEQHKSGVDVRIAVDNKTAQQKIYGTVPAWLKEQGVPIVQWKDPDYPYFAFHKKVLIVDGIHVVAGGMNFGDVYSHLGPDTTPKWRDTDFYAIGNAAVDSQKIFIKNWNEQVEKNKLPYSKLVSDLTELNEIDEANKALVMVIEQTPNPEAKDPILTSIVKGIEGATKEINIENAYFIENPAIHQALIRAIKRGVKVSIFTNSTHSIDVPIIAKPILKALDTLYRLGAKVYLKKGPTLHSKFMTIDRLASWVMSYNHHPQSMRIQGEIAYIILDASFANNLASQFQYDVTTLSDQVKDIKTLQPERDLLDIILQRYFFDQL